MTGEVAILNVGSGDTKLTFDPKKPAECERAAKVVDELLARGFAILVQVGTRKGEPLYQRAKGFDPKTKEYIIVGAPEDAEIKEPTPPRRKAGKARRVKASGTRAVAVARSAGG